MLLRWWLALRVHWEYTLSLSTAATKEHRLQQPGPTGLNWKNPIPEVHQTELPSTDMSDSRKIISMIILSQDVLPETRDK